MRLQKLVFVDFGRNKFIQFKGFLCRRRRHDVENKQIVMTLMLISLMLFLCRLIWGISMSWTVQTLLKLGLIYQSSIRQLSGTSSKFLLLGERWSDEELPLCWNFNLRSEFEAQKFWFLQFSKFSLSSGFWGVLVGHIHIHVQIQAFYLVPLLHQISHPLLDPSFKSYPATSTSTSRSQLFATSTSINYFKSSFSCVSGIKS